MYVQDVLRKQLSEEVWQVLYQSTGHLYVCGGMNIARDVAHTIQEILVNRLGITLIQAGAYLDQLKVQLLADFTTALTRTNVGNMCTTVVIALRLNGKPGLP